jgi:hypothetical protein
MANTASPAMPNPWARASRVNGDVANGRVGSRGDGAGDDQGARELGAE